MDLKKLKQFLKALSDDTRLRVVSLLKNREMPVKDLCLILNVSQPMISKHLVRLRLLGLVSDRRAGNFVYYSLNKNADSEQRKILDFILDEFNDLDVFQQDREQLNRASKGQLNFVWGNKEEKTKDCVNL